MEEAQQICFSNEFSELTGVHAIPWSETYCTEFHASIPFLYETALLCGLEAFRPWENPEHYFSQVIDQWEQVKNGLQEKFSKREREGVSEMMRKGIAFFYELLFWCNGKPVELKNKLLSTFVLKPINTEERLSFILSRPANYHSYVQLTELFIELEKIFSKEIVMKKASKP